MKSLTLQAIEAPFRLAGRSAAGRGEGGNFQLTCLETSSGPKFSRRAGFFPQQQYFGLPRKKAKYRKSPQKVEVCFFWKVDIYSPVFFFSFEFFCFESLASSGPHVFSFFVS